MASNALNSTVKTLMKVLLIGSGGREHALAWAISASPLLDKLFIAPGNPGTAQCGVNVPLDVNDHAGIIGFCLANRIGLVVVGPEGPLVAGLADDLSANGIKVFGPSKAAAQLEGSKAFTKAICDEANIPTAAYIRLNDLSAALAHISGIGAPIVVKYDGLAAGKGVTVALSIAEADAALRAIYRMEPNATVVIEECMVGEEVSFFALVDGEIAVPLAAAQDHKRAFDGDLGPNTGGMGAYSPAPVFSPALQERTMREIVLPTARAMARRGTPYRGVLFAGLMLTAGGPKLIEYNCRFGDPETQVLLLRLRDDLLTLLLATVDGQLANVSVRWRDEAAVAVVMAADGYPGRHALGSVIRGISSAEAIHGVTVFHAGTKLRGGELTAAGGRVLNICAIGATAAEARARAYAAIENIDWPEGFCRADIAARAL